MKYYYCRYCGNLVEVIDDSGNVPICCARDMQELIPSSTDASVEKHTPTVRIKELECGDKSIIKLSVQVGEIPHPSTKEHYIKWIEVETDKGRQRCYLVPDDKPCARFFLNRHEKVIAVYAYCNIHGLWVTQM